MRRSFTLCMLFFIFLAPLPGTLAAQITAGKPMQTVYIDGYYFTDPNLGVKKYMEVEKKVQSEFKPRIDEVTAMQKKLDDLKKVLETPSATKPQAKYDEYDNLHRNLLRKREDFDAQYKKRYADLIKPINEAIGIAIKQWCKQKGFDVLIDISRDDKGTFLYVDEEKLDATTKELIKHLNTVL